jgi:hypothetical protein
VHATKDFKLYQRDEATECKLKVETVSCRRRRNQRDEATECFKIFLLEVRTVGKADIIDGLKLHKKTAQ